MHPDTRHNVPCGHSPTLGQQRRAAVQQIEGVGAQRVVDDPHHVARNVTCRAAIRKKGKSTLGGYAVRVRGWGAGVISVCTEGGEGGGG